MRPRQLKFDTPTSGHFGPNWKKRSLGKKLQSVLDEFPFVTMAPADETGEPPELPRPYALVIEATHATEGSAGWSKVSSMSKYIIPSAELSAVELEGRLLRDGALVKAYEARGTYKTRKHLLFLLAPWMWKLGAPGATAQDTFRDLLAQVERDAAAWSGGATASP
jgi:hypothetical protein